jgi:hypothetical protein
MMSLPRPCHPRFDPSRSRFTQYLPQMFQPVDCRSCVRIGVALLACSDTDRHTKLIVERSSSSQSGIVLPMLGAALMCSLRPCCCSAKMAPVEDLLEPLHLPHATPQRFGRLPHTHSPATAFSTTINFCNCF